MRDSLLPESGIPYMVLDGKGRSLGWNDEAFEAFGDCALGDIRAIVLPNVTSEEGSRFAYLLDDAIPHFTFDFSFPSNNGEVRWFRLIMSRLEKGGYLALFDDIESFKLRERSLVAARETAEKASMSRSQFLANISHEIRTPIQTIIGMMELLDETKLDEEQTEYVRQVKFSADVMLTLINDVLDFSKVEAGQLKIEHIEYDLSNVIERTVDLVSMEAHRKELEICIEIADDLPAMVIGDPSRLQQIILNLVKNAVKFTAKGYILVSAKSLGDKAHFEVTDTGIGIKSDVQDRLFTQFFQADASTTRKYGGTGLGLAISRNIVELMSGQIGVMNNPSGGSCFWFNVPLVAAEKQPPKETLPLRPDTKFLIVDDNELTLSILTSMLRSMGYSDITRSMSGEQALDELHGARTIAKPFDIVLIDMVMPEMDGWRLAAEINKNREINQAQLYLMVPEGSFGADAKMKLLEWFNGYLYKPIKRRKLAELLREHWESSIDLEIVEELESPESEADSTAAPAPASGVQARPGSVSVSAEGISAEDEELPAAGLTVLIAEDHPVNRKLIRIFLEKAGANVVAAEDGQEATELMGKNKVDLVFMDIQMPRMNGYEASSWMRSHGFSQPIIACTASAQENEREQCLLFGMTDILPKPYKKNQITEMLLKYTKKSGENGATDADAPAETGEDLSVPVFDSMEFFDIMMGDIDAAKTLMAEYIGQTKAHLEVLAEDISENRLEEASRTAHLIKGSSLNVTAHRLAQASLAVEKGAATLSPAELRAAFARMRSELSALEKRLGEEGYRQ